ncbi:34865_t:CDS:2 [Racocetra persica]|uniref:34865_t:CDS:1 n=1 Tax=Racocetra persica TaxID=160502 RepID=A0ACA9L2F1_9GLOM|nr:34865_t:CDS:2 [Racocetra persica]
MAYQEMCLNTIAFKGVSTADHKSTLNGSKMFGCTWGALPSG